jgi:general secretion pathway protein E
VAGGIVASDAIADETVSGPVIARLGTEVENNASRKQVPLEADPGFVERIPIQYARHHKVLGLVEDNGAMPLAVTADAPPDVLDILGRYLGVRIDPIVVDEDKLLVAINRAYEARDGQTEQFLEDIDEESVDNLIDQAGLRDDLLETDGLAPVIKLVNLLLFEAVKAKASDLHIQPYEHQLVVRQRIDGVLFDVSPIPKHLQEEVASRFKVIGGMNIAERRLPQDGRSTVQLGDRVIDLRMSSVPTSFGERIVVRLLDKSAELYSLEEVGMDAHTLEHYRGLIGIEHGLILLTGPTGSGKTTTLYAALTEIDAKQRNIMTLEDPIEYQLAGISQMQVNPRKGMTFASGLRSVLRQDPDIIMVGEIRDHETAVMAIQSALTGHLVFSTLHTNDSASAVTRLLDLGIEPYLVASSVAGVMAQRLVRRVCEQCGQPNRLDREQLERLGYEDAGVDTTKVRHGVGCEACRHTGYRGRVGLFELLRVDDKVRGLIQKREPAGPIKSAAMDAGMRTLRSDGLNKVLRGLTTAEEVVRVTTR